MKKNIVFILSILFLFACEEAEIFEASTYNCQLSGQDDSAVHPQKEVLQAALEDIGQHTAGVQVAIRSADGLSWSGAYGMADISNQIAFSTCNKTMVGSISKTFTAVLIMQLQDEGILTVDDALRDWLGNDLIGEIANADQVSIRQLLNHTSGIRDYLGIEQYINALNTPFFQETQAEKLRYIYGKDAEYEPGQQYSYSNTNYVLLGLIVEKARNMSLWDAVDRYIAQPLALFNAEMGTHDVPIPLGTARAYRPIRTGKYEDIMHLAVSDAATGDGGIASNMQDLNLFIEALFNGGILSAAAFQQMTDSEMIIVGEGEEDYPQWPNESYGLGISRWNTPYGTAYGHTGSTSNYEAYMFYFPEKKVSISIGYNAVGGKNFGDRQRDFREALFKLLLGS